MLTMWCTSAIMMQATGPSETSVNFYKTTRRHSQRPELFNYEINPPGHHSTLYHTYVRTSSLEMRCTYMQYSHRYDSLVSYRLVGRSKKPVASYGGRTLSCLSVCPQVAFGCVNAHNMMVSVAYHNYPIQDSNSLISRGCAIRKYPCLYEEE